MKIAFTETFILIGFQLIPALAFSQKQDTIYFDNLWQICKKEMASYYRYGTVAVDSFAYYSGKVQDYYVTGVLEMEGSYSKDGYKKWVEQNVVFVYEGGRCLGYQAIVKDVTDTKLGEDLLQETNKKGPLQKYPVDIKKAV